MKFLAIVVMLAVIGLTTGIGILIVNHMTKINKRYNK
jgi:hypothetical protein